MIPGKLNPTSKETNQVLSMQKLNQVTTQRDILRNEEESCSMQYKKQQKLSPLPANQIVSQESSSIEDKLLNFLPKVVLRDITKDGYLKRILNDNLKLHHTASHGRSYNLRCRESMKKNKVKSYEAPPFIKKKKKKTSKRGPKSRLRLKCYSQPFINKKKPSKSGPNSKLRLRCYSLKKTSLYNSYYNKRDNVKYNRATICTDTQQHYKLLGKIRHFTQFKRSIKVHVPTKKNSNIDKTYLSTENFLCELCANTYKQESTLKQHQAFFHSSDEMFQCKICLKKFKQYMDLNCHKRIHPKKRLFQCVNAQ